MTARRTVMAWVSAATLTLGALPATAQPGPSTPSAGRIEIAAGVTMAGGAELGSATANLTPNLNGGSFALFSASATHATPAGGDVRVAFRITPWLLVGVAGALARGDVRVRIAADSEGGQQPEFSGEPLGQGSLEGRVDVLLTRLRAWQGRLTPFVSLSGGVLRQWHDSNVIIETGYVIQSGAGLRWVLANRPASRLSRVGVSAEVGVTQVNGGFHWGREQRTVPSARLACVTGWGR